MPTLPDDFFIQKVILLGSGAPGTVAFRDELTRLYVENADLTQFEAFIDDFMTPLSEYGNNDSDAKRTLFEQGFGPDIDLTPHPQKIDQLTADSLRQGIDSWHEYFSYLINQLDSNVDKALDNRAAAAAAFTDLLKQRNIEVNVNDPLVQDWIDQVNATDDSLIVARTTLEDTINQFITPVLVGSDPLDNAIDVLVNKDIVLTFNEAVKAGAGEIIIAGDDGHRIPLDVTDTTQVIFDGSKVRLNPSEDLHFDMNYNVQANSGVITDLGEIPFAGTNDPTALNFQTVNLAPTLVSSDPVDNAADVPVNKDIVLTFSEAVKAGAGEIVIAGTDGHRILLNVADTTQVRFDGSSLVTLNPSENLHFDVNYNVQANSGVITDLAEIPFAGTSDPAALNFQTGPDNVPPTLDSSVPADNAVEVPFNANIDLIFSEAVKAGIGEIIITGDDGHRITLNVTDATQVTFDGSIVRLNPNDDLHFDMNYNVQANSGVITDLTEIPFAGTNDPTALNFHTAPDIIPPSPPTLSSTNPADDATGVAVGNDIVLTFNKTVRVGSGNIVISDESEDIRTIPVTDTNQITFSGSTVTINPTADLNPGAAYQVIVESGAIADLAGTPYGGLSDLNFDTVPSGGIEIFLVFGADTITAGAGNDTFTANLDEDGAENLVNSLEDIDVLDGGDGTDTLNAILNAATTTPSITSIEIINIQNIDNDATINFSDTVNAVEIWNNASLVGRTLTYEAAPLAAVFGVRTTESTTNINILDDLSGPGNNLRLTTIGADDEEAALAVITSSNAADIETLSIDARSGFSPINVSAFTAITALTVTGAGALGVDVAETVLQTIDASANTGGVSVDLGGAAAELTVTGGTGDDIITGGDASDEIAGGDGNDDITGASGDDSIEGGSGNDIIHGEGNDQVAGVDVITGGLGGDDMEGSGIITFGVDDQISDTFIIAAPDSLNTSLDFIQMGVSDILDLPINMTSASPSEGADFTSVASVPSTGATADTLAADIATVAAAAAENAFDQAGDTISFELSGDSIRGTDIFYVVQNQGNDSTYDAAIDTVLALGMSPLLGIGLVGGDLQTFAFIP